MNCSVSLNPTYVYRGFYYITYSKRERGTEKTLVIGAVERGGKVVAQVAENLIGRSIRKFIRGIVNLKYSELITDEYHTYNAVGKEMKHVVVNHSNQFVDGDTRGHHRRVLIATQASLVWTTSPLSNRIHVSICGKGML